ncbi:MAG: hypothetical protein Kow0062_13060 [Acidobacteriota bacterium]
MATKKKNEDRKIVPEEVRESAHKIWLAGLGALATAEEEGSRLFRTLVERGEEFESRGRERVGRVLDTVGGQVGTVRKTAEERLGKLGSGVEEAVMRALKQLGVPSREEIDTLNRRIEELARSIEALRPEAAKPKARTSSSTAKKTARDTAH